MTDSSRETDRKRQTETAQEAGVCARAFLRVHVCVFEREKYTQIAQGKVTERNKRAERDNKLVVCVWSGGWEGSCLYVLRATKGRDGWRKGRRVAEVEKKRPKKQCQGESAYARARAQPKVSAACAVWLNDDPLGM